MGTGGRKARTVGERRACQERRRAREFETFVAGAGGRLLRAATLLTGEPAGAAPAARRLLEDALARTYAGWDGRRAELRGALRRGSTGRPRSSGAGGPPTAGCRVRPPDRKERDVRALLDTGPAQPVPLDLAGCAARRGARLRCRRRAVRTAL